MLRIMVSAADIRYIIVHSLWRKQCISIWAEEWCC